MLDKVARVVARYDELGELMADPAVSSDLARLTEYARERSELEELATAYRRYQQAEAQLASARSLLEEGSDDEELAALVRDEIAAREEEMAALTVAMRRLLLPKDPNDEKNVIVEIRAGAGGEEAGLFAADLFRMYTRYAEAHRWKTELLSSNETGIGGFKEIIFQVKGKGAYSRLKYESGVHRVQRVPTTEASGRIHTSTATVAVLPEMDDVDVHIAPEDVQFEVFRSSGPGGQHMQKNSTAVRLIHLPSGLVVECQSERSQTQNRERAMAVLRARLYALAEEKRMKEVGDARRSQVGTGERSEKIRTYNFPQNRVTDHRIGLSSYRLQAILDGGIDEFIDELATTEEAERLEAVGEEA
ncbi:MAG: peptide chain release factor 1 [Anaerolineae bacterium]|nr:peptide chain release factor 1 [Anaerolineae bacterium]